MASSAPVPGAGLLHKLDAFNNCVLGCVLVPGRDVLITISAPRLQLEFSTQFQAVSPRSVKVWLLESGTGGEFYQVCFQYITSTPSCIAFCPDQR